MGSEMRIRDRVTFLGSPKYVKNPYLRATFTKLLRYLVPRSESNEALASHGSERLAAVFHTHRLAQAHLAPALMQFFVDIEFTGSHTGAYDKYEYRHEMCQILEYLWTLPEYRQVVVPALLNGGEGRGSDWDAIAH